jgi:hypothetical protein
MKKLLSTLTLMSVLLTSSAFADTNTGSTTTSTPVVSSTGSTVTNS